MPKLKGITFRAGKPAHQPKVMPGTDKKYSLSAPFGILTGPDVWELGGAVNRQPAVIVDMDGTLCDVSTVIHLQAEPDGFNAFHNACAQCPPHRAVVDWCAEQHSHGHAILIVTGRDAWSRELTEQWLTKHLPVPIAGLHMRGEDDYRSNATIKREIHRTLEKDYDIRAAIEDDPEIVALWRDVGINVAMVLDGGDVLVLD